MGSRWHLGILAAALLGTALCAFAQMPSSPPPAVCPECARFVRQYEEDFSQWLRADSEARAAPSDEVLKGKAEGWLKAVDQDAPKIRECVLSCKKRDGVGERVPFPPLPPEIPRLNHFEAIAACPACDGAARNARDKLHKLRDAEWHYLQTRRLALQNEAWLKVHARERDTEQYDSHFVDYVRALHEMSLSEAPLEQALVGYAAAMRDLKDCNSRLCKDLPRATLVGPWDAPVAMAACPVCEEYALDLEQALLALANQLASPASEEWAQRSLISSFEESVKKKREALETCNIQFPAASCKPPTTTGQNALSGGTAGPQGTTGKSGLPGGPAGPAVTPPPAIPPDKPTDTTPPPAPVPPPVKPLGGIGTGVPPIIGGAQAGSAATGPPMPDCPECRELEAAYARERAYPSGTPTQGFLGESPLQKLGDKLRACRAACFKRTGLPPLPAAIPMVRHFEPIAACPACSAAALGAVRALYELSTAERRYLNARVAAVQERAWLSAHADATGTAEYSAKMAFYADDFYALLEEEKELKKAQQAFDNAMRALADCNDRLCKDEYKESVLPERNFEEPAVACPECELDALHYRFAVMWLLGEEAVLRELIAERSKILPTKLTRAPTDAELARVRQLNEYIRHREGYIAEAEKLVESSSAALDACNKAHPAESCKPPTTTGQNVLPGSTTIQPFGGGIGYLQGLTGWSLIADYKAPTNMYTVGPSWTEGPPKTLPTGDAFTFEVKGDAAALDAVFANPFVFDPHSHALPNGGYLVSSSAGANPSETWTNLQALAQSGKIVNLEVDPSWHFLPDSPAAEANKAVHLSDSFGATLLEPYRKAPVAGAFILYGPLPPTPFFDPGERAGDDLAPTIVRSDSNGAYRASLGGFSGPVEIRVAKGSDERRAFAIVDPPTPPAAASAAVPAAQSTSTLKKP